MATRIVPRLEITETLHPSILENTRSEDIYIQPVNPGYNLPGNVLEFDFPNDACLDLSNSYLQFNLQATNTTAAVAEVYTFTLAAPAGVATATAGTFRFSIGDSISAPLPFNATDLQIRTAIFGMKGFPNDIDLIRDPALAIQLFSRFQILTNTLSTAAPGILSFSINYNAYKLKQHNVPVFLILSLTNAAAVPLLPLDSSPANDGVLSWPQIPDGGVSVIQEVNVSYNNQDITQINDYARFWTIMNRMRLTEYEQTENELLTTPTGPYADINTQIKYAIPLYGCGILGKIIPLNLIPGNSILRIRIRLAQINDALQYDPAAFPTPGYQLYNARYYCSKLKLTRTTAEAFSEKIAKNDLCYYFDDWKNVSDACTTSTVQLNVNPNVSHLSQVLSVMQQDDFTSNPLNAFRLSSFITNYVKKARLRVGTIYLPPDYLQSDSDNEYVEFLIELLTSMGQWASLQSSAGINHSEIVSYKTYTAARHDDLFTVSYQTDKPPSFIIGINVSQDTVDMLRDHKNVYQAGLNTQGLSNVLLQTDNLNLESANTQRAWYKNTSKLTIGSGRFVYSV